MFANIFFIKVTQILKDGVVLWCSCLLYLRKFSMASILCKSLIIRIMG